MSFGFSIGDFVAVGALVVQVAGCLRDVGGSAAEYQQVTKELGHLQVALARLGENYKDGYQAPAVQEINCVLKDCRTTMEDWLGKIAKYNNQLGTSYAQSTGRSRTGAALVQKVRWRFGEGLQAQEMRLKLAFYIQTIGLLLVAKSQETTQSLASQIKANNSDLTMLLRIQHNEFKTSSDDTQSMISELKSAIDPMTSNVEAIRTYIETFVHAWNNHQPGHPPSQNLQSCGKQLCAAPEEYDWNSVDPKIQSLVLQRLYNRLEDLRPTIATDLKEISREQNALRNNAAKVSLISIGIQQFVGGAILHVRYISPIFSGPIYTFRSLSLVANPAPRLRGSFDIVKRPETKYQLTCTGPLGQNASMEVSNLITVLHGHKYEHSFKVDIDGCGSIEELSVRIDISYKRLYEKNWVSWLFISNLTQHELIGRDATTILFFLLHLASSFKRVPFEPHHINLPSKYLHLCHSKWRPREVLDAPDQPLIRLVLEPNCKRIALIVGITCLLFHLEFIGKRANEDFLRDSCLLLSSCFQMIYVLCFCRKPPWSKYPKIRGSKKLYASLLLCAIIVAAEVYWTNLLASKALIPGFIVLFCSLGTARAVEDEEFLFKDLHIPLNQE
ncbi:MAG: hypothetical protein MMC33_003908 [Icmadophila ericetorum]|nr:hypothetical protein [Icmadophila ericetorum]